MSCELWEIRLANGETGTQIDSHLAACAECRSLAVELRENAVALAAMRDDVTRDEARDEVMPDEVVPPGAAPARKVARRWPWVAALAAAAMLTVVLWPHREAPVEPVQPIVQMQPQPVIPLAPPKPVRRPIPPPKPKPQPLLVKMLTDDPDVVIYWLIDEEEGERAI